MKAELKFLIDFYSPIESKTFKAGSSIAVDIDENNIIENKFWREQMKFNDISKAFELILPKANSENLDIKPKSKK